MKMLANLAKEEIPFMHIGLTTSKKWVRGAPSSGQGFYSSLWPVDSFHALRGKSKPTVDLCSSYTKINDVGMLDGSIQYGYDFMEKIPVVEKAASIPGDPRSDCQKRIRRQNKPNPSNFSIIAWCKS